MMGEEGLSGEFELLDKKDIDESGEMVEINSDQECPEDQLCNKNKQHMEENRMSKSKDEQEE